MASVQGITSLAAGDGRHPLFRTFGPTLLISMPYIDLGKWVAAVDAGARFGYDLVLMVLLFNCSAILCQYLSICIGVVTGKNLAEICHQEYSRAICALLGLQAGLSLVLSEVTMIQRRHTVRTLGSLFHEHLFSIIFIFSGVFLVNYILVSSAADEVGHPVLLTGQDAVELMHQIFINPLALVVLLVILLFSSLIVSLASIISSDLISDNFFSVKLPYSVHHILLKAFAIIPTIYCAKVGGSEGMYQLLVVCPVAQAMVLPSCVIPVFRVSSSRVLMGRYRVSLYVETLAVLAFLLMLFTNIVFLAEILFGDSSWTYSMRRNTNSPVVLPYTIILLISCASTAFTLFLAATPLKSASIDASQGSSEHPQKENLGSPSHREETCQENTAQEVQKFSVDAVVKDSLEGQQERTFERTEHSGPTTQSDLDSHYPTAHTIINHEAHPSASVDRKELKSVVGDYTEAMPKDRTSTKVKGSIAENIRLKSTTENLVVESDFHTEKDNEVSFNLKNKKPDLGRAARRQLAALLDEFWGHLFDYHGQLTHEAKTKCLNYLVGMDLRTTSSAVRTDNPSEASWSPLMGDMMGRSATSLKSSGPLLRGKGTSHPHLDFGLQGGAMESSNWSPSIHRAIRYSSRNAELFSKLKVPSYTDNQFYQPATFHGYQLASYLKEINASRRPFSTIPMDLQQFLRSSESSFPNYINSFMYGHDQNFLGSPRGSSLQSPTMNNLNTMLLERSYYDPTSVGGNESAYSSAYTKKYHSSPDISVVIAAARNNLLSEANLNSGAAANQSYLGRLAHEKSRYMNSTTPSQDVFHNLLQRDVLPTQSSANTNAKSLWIQQPFDQLSSVSSTETNNTKVNPDWTSSITSDFTCIQHEAELVSSVRLCITKLMQLEGSHWLFRKNSGCDENLIGKIVEAETVSQEETTNDRDVNCMHKPDSCGDDCIWRASLVTSFGVWCVHRVLDLSLVESRPELWGKYTYVLNRLQGILDPAFSKPRKPLRGCACLEKAESAAKPIPGTFTTATEILDLIKAVEQAISSRKDRSGTAAGSIAFPKGKENLASVLKRYKRRLAGKASAGA